MKKKMKMKSKTESSTNAKTEITLTFEGNRVIGAWYHEGLAPILCALCKEKCGPGKMKCANVNPYCG